MKIDKSRKAENGHVTVGESHRIHPTFLCSDTKGCVAAVLLLACARTDGPCALELCLVVPIRYLEVR
jgi:hypothetical protein